MESYKEVDAGVQSDIDQSTTTTPSEKNVSVFKYSLEYMDDLGLGEFVAIHTTFLFPIPSLYYDVQGSLATTINKIPGIDVSHGFGAKVYKHRLEFKVSKLFKPEDIVAEVLDLVERVHDIKLVGIYQKPPKPTTFWERAKGWFQC